jgi:hypothetical protein
VGALALLLVAAGCAHRSGSSPGAKAAVEPPELAAVRRYLADEEPPEQFGDDRLPVRIRGFTVWDVDGDGTREVILWTDPYYRQSPTITLYSVSSAGKVRRLIEGLAPGPLVPATSTLRDSHTLGRAVDVANVQAEKRRAAGTAPDRAADDAFGRDAVATALGRRQHVVQYPSFVHTDGRVGAGSFVDLSQERGGFAEGSDGCRGFEFAPIEDVTVGTLGGEPQGRYVAAAAGGRLDLYRIERIQADGTLLKRRWAAPKPGDFVRFVGAPGGTIRYETRTGAQVVLPAPRGQ